MHRHDPAGATEVSLGWKQEKPLTIKDTKEKNRVVATSDEVAFDVRVEQARKGNDSSIIAETMSDRVGNAVFGIRRASGKDRFEVFADAPNFEFDKAVGNPWSSLGAVKYYGFPDAARASFQNAGFVADLAFGLERQLQNVYYLGPLLAQSERLYAWSGERPTDMGRAGEAAVAAMLSSAHGGEKISLGQGRRRRSLEQHVAYWLKELGLIHDFHVVRLTADSPLYQVKVRKSAGGPETLITDVGFAVPHILPELVLCFYVPKGSTIILEQPEIHLHSAVQADLQTF